jgi:hypothetical protein
MLFRTFAVYIKLTGMSIRIDYRLTGAGWADCFVHANGATYELSASYLSDALGNLVLAAAGLLSGLHSASASFDEEPGEFRWVLEHAGGVGLVVRVVEFQELWGDRPLSEGKQLFRYECNPLEFAEAIESAATLVLTQHGIAGYKERWVQHDFPEMQLALLRHFIERRRAAR